MKIDKIKYSDLIDLGFERVEIDDDVLFQQTGYSGFVLEMKFDYLKVGISTGCFVSNENKQWDFKLYNTESGDIIRKVEIIELKNLIEYFKLKDDEVFNCFEQIELLKNENNPKN